ncbi:enoyl-CoA hydratase/isomerase family protein [Streptomyces muensis]|uniref:Enoyl-CoA hydratase/isomerase family protein n=1 Tax=Streptomyces muensis TaxID=1077944 RepID=A0A9X1PV71_STRM4|nr:enoyl-CoA hydratase/isomerase family protein [Streptomyces muensis]MCF1592308.1 enoyl-CoA hydratase/isomerase family protein [Streptomyces muensis]
MTDDDTLVRFTRRGAGGWITLNRPDKRNALTPALIGDLHRALDACDSDPRVRAVVITGAGDAFCAGADLAHLRERLDDPDGCELFVEELLRPLASALGRLRDSGRPTIAAVNGACFAGGFELLMGCDLVIASEAATFCDAHSRRGLAPAVGGEAGLVNAVGATRARRILMLAEVLDAHQLAQAGLVSEVVPSDGLVERVDEVTAVIARRSPTSVSAVKFAVQRCESRPWQQAVDEGIEEFRRLWKGSDMLEGIQAFLERRAPRYGSA